MVRSHPIRRRKCLEARACIRVIEEVGNFFIEIEIAGNRQRIPLGNSCVEARYYVFAAKVCVANFAATAHSLNFDVVLRLCIDANLGPIHIGECIDVYSQHVSIGFFTVDELTRLGFAHPIVGVSGRGGDKAYAYVETSISKKALEELERKLSETR